MVCGNDARQKAEDGEQIPDLYRQDAISLARAIGEDREFMVMDELEKLNTRARSIQQDPETGSDPLLSTELYHMPPGNRKL